MKSTFYVVCEYEYDQEYDVERFAVLELTDIGGKDYLFLVDPWARYLTMAGLAYDIAGQLGLDPDEVEVEEV